jgi:hypothetical protein
MLQLLVTANLSKSPILVTLMMEAVLSSDTFVLIRATLRHIPEDGILQILSYSPFWDYQEQNIITYIFEVLKTMSPITCIFRQL